MLTGPASVSACIALGSVCLDRSIRPDITVAIPLTGVVTSHGHPYGSDVRVVVSADEGGSPPAYIYDQACFPSGCLPYSLSFGSKSVLISTAPLQAARLPSSNPVRFTQRVSITSKRWAIERLIKNVHLVTIGYSCKFLITEGELTCR